MIRYFSIACPPEDEEDAVRDMADFLSDVPGLVVMERSVLKVQDGRMRCYARYKGQGHAEDMEGLIAEDVNDGKAVIIWQKEARYGGDTIILTGVSGTALVSVIGPERAVRRFGDWLVETAGSFGWGFDKTF